MQQTQRAVQLSQNLSQADIAERYVYPLEQLVLILLVKK